MFARIGRWCYRRRWTVIGLWFLVLMVGGSILGAVGTNTFTEFTLPDVESKTGVDILEEEFGGMGAGQAGSLVFIADESVEDPQVEAPVEGVLNFIRYIGTDDPATIEAIPTVATLATELAPEIEDPTATVDEVAEAAETAEQYASSAPEGDLSEVEGTDDARDAVMTLAETIDEAVDEGATLDLEQHQALGAARAFGVDVDVEDIEGVGDVRVTSPYGPDGEDLIAQDGDVAGDLVGRLAYAEIEVSSDMSFEDATVLGEEIRDAIPERDGLEMELGGITFAEFEEPTAELIGLAFAIVILIVAFGSVLAMGLPIGIGLAGIGVGTILAGLASHVFEVPDFAQMIGIMIGLGVGIDYALFIVTRFRENRRTGHTIEESITIAINTAGRAVAFAGATVVISLLGMIIMQLGFITGMAISASVVVATTMIASLTLLPALMALVGHRIEVTRWRGIIAAGFVSIALLGLGFELAPLLLGLPLAIVVLLVGIAFAPLKRELPPRKVRPMEETASYRWSRLIQRRPWPAAAIGTAILVIIALPVFAIRLGFSDEGNYPEDTDTRAAYDLLSEGFGPGFNGPLVLTSLLPADADPDTLATSTGGVTEALDELAAVEGDGGSADDARPIRSVSQARCNNPGGDPDQPVAPCDEAVDPTAVMWQVVPETSPQDEATTTLVHDLRDDVLPRATDGTGLDVSIAGSVAISVDFTDYLGQRLPLFLFAVLALSFLLLMVVFRSILVPLKAVVMNLLGIGAAYGVLIAGFQWGWLGPVLGIDAGPIEPFMPMMLFAIVFGLSMDYEVFLLSRVKEDWDRSGDSHTSVANGLAATARVITAAALIMMTVFAAFSLGDDRVIKMAGIGLASAVFIDATIIRMLLVPATMELLGDRNWWFPKWLDRILPTIDVEGHAAEEEARATAHPEEESELEKV